MIFPFSIVHAPLCGNFIEWRISLMNQKALALLVTMMVCMPGAAYAARTYDGQPLATKNGPAYEPQTVDDVARRAAQAEAIRKLQDEPDQFAEEAIQAGK